MMETDKEKLFASLKAIMISYSETLECTEDTASAYNLYTKHIMKNKKPLYFGGIKINKSFVSYHLMPLYIYPDLKDGLNDELKRLLKGKSCFNMKSLDETLLSEVRSLTDACYRKYVSEGYV